MQKPKFFLENERHKISGDKPQILPQKTRLTVNKKITYPLEGFVIPAEQRVKIR